MKTASKQQLLQKSAELVGKSKLAQRLRIPEARLDSWMRGDATVPDGQLLRLAQILVDLADPNRNQEPTK